MKIGIDINPMLEKIVGKGLFLKNTIRVLQVIDRENEYFLFGKEDPHTELQPNFHFVQIKGNLGSKWDFKCVALQKFRYRTHVFLTVKSFYSAIFHPRSVFGLHDVGPLQLPEAYPQATINKFKRLVPIVLKRAQRIITPSSATKSYLVNHYKISLDRIIKIPEAAPSWANSSVQSEDINRITQKYMLPEKYFLFVGTLEPRKNLIRLIQAFRLFCDKTKSDYKLLIVGKKSYSYEKIFKEVINLQLTQQVIFTGHIPEFDLKPIYIRAAALVFPSLLEGFALTPLEAMVCNIPVICSKIGALGEVVDNACISIDPQDTQSIKNGMLQAVTNPKLREEIIKKGEIRAQKFSWEKCGRKLLKVLQEVAA